MRGMPFNFQGNKGVVQILEAAAAAEVDSSKKRKRKVFEGLEPRSVLDSRRSPSPPSSSSSSTLSSSLGGSAGSSDTAGVAAVSDNNPSAAPAHRWPPTSTAPPPADEGRDEWASEELHPIPAGLELGGGGGGDKCGGMAAEEWEAMLSMPPTTQAATPTQEQTFLQWIMDDPANTAAFSGSNTGFGMVDPGFVVDPIGAMASGAAAAAAATSASATTISPPATGGFGFHPMSSSTGNNLKVPIFGNSLPLPLSLPPGALYQESMDDKQLLYGPGLVLHQQHQQSHHAPNPAFFLPVPPPFAAIQQERHRAAMVEPTCQIPSKAPPYHLHPQQQAYTQPNAAPPYHLQQRQMKPKSAAGDEVMAHQQQQQQQALVDQLFKAAELIETGNPVSARGILARLNHQLPSPLGKPLHRSAFYFKEALHHIANTPSTSSIPHHRPPATPLDVVLKLGTYKAFSEVSPVLQFSHFTCIQTLLEELGSADRIHIIDFDIAVGGQWSSFMQELAQRRCSSTAAAAGTTPLLKITAFASPNSHHPLELYLTRENLTHFARDLNIPFEFSVLSLDPFDPSLLLSMCAGVDEAIAVNLPVGCAYHPPISSLLRLVKQISPKIVVSVDHGCDRSDLSFSHQFLHAFQACTVLLDSIDAAGTNLDVSNKIERFLLQPRVESALMGRHCAGEKMLPWCTLFASAGFVPVQFSNFAETQAECLLKRVQVRGFHVEKRQASLFLCWQRGELVSVSAWRC